MKTSVFYDHIMEAAQQSGKTIPEVLSLCAGWGIDAVELRYDHLVEDPAIPLLLKAAGLRISCMYGFADFAASSDMTYAVNLLKAAVSLGASRIMVIPGELPPSDARALRSCADDAEATFRFMDEHPATLRMANCLSGLVRKAQEAGMTVVLEDFDGDLQPFARMHQLHWFMQHVPGLRLAMDTGNFVYSDEDALEAYRLLGSYTAHVHCKDRGEEPDKAWGKVNHGLAPVAVGKGYMPIAPILDDLKVHGYDGYIAIEHFGSDRQLDLIADSAAWLRTWAD